MKWYLAGAVGAAALLAAACTDVNAPTAATKRSFPNKPSLNSPVNGAAYTSVNEGVDGSGHCKNGNPNNNCNIYDGKQYVWLNGGPTAGAVGDGNYFFAVLAPSGQADPNDGSTDLLSTDLYTARTFSISGTAITYAGPHDFSDNKIRLMPYADTPNPGGVYIMAICSLADGYPVDPSDCKYDAFKIQEGEQTSATDPTITKDADGAYDNTFTWTITKSVDKTTVTQVGGNATFNYTVTVTHDAGTISNVNVSGTISVFNTNLDASNNIVPVNITSVTDQLSDGTVCTVTGGGAQALTVFQTDFAYSCDLDELPEGSLDNVATVTWPSQTLTNGHPLAGGSANFTFSDISFDENAIDETVSVSDSYAGTLGTVSVGDANPKTFTYSRTIAIPRNGCLSYPNTATFTTNDTGATGSASQSVSVCGPPATGALTIGFWKGPNGNSLIKYYCAPAGKTSLATYLSALGTGSGPFAAAAGKTCDGLVTYVNGVLGSASATDMNVMLKAQMLGTALDVYFSTATLGWTSTPNGGGKNPPKPPSNFFSSALSTIGGLGVFNMDVTKVCPMVDNTTAGDAVCKLNAPSTDAVASGALPSSPMSIQAILNFAATTPSPFSAGVWYGGNRTKQEILKNVFDQFNNQFALGSF